LKKKITQGMKAQKKVIDALRSRPLRFGELVKQGIPEKTVERILRELDYYRLVTKGERGRLDYWYWYDQVRTPKSFTSKQLYEQYMEHCRTLIPSFKHWISIQFLTKDEIKFVMTSDKPYRDLSAEALRYMEFVEEHLKTGYPRTLGKMEELRMYLQNLTENERNLEEIAKEKLFLELKERTPALRWIREDSGERVRENYWERQSEELARRVVSVISAEARRPVMEIREKIESTPTDETLDLKDYMMELNLEPSMIAKVRESMKNEFESLKKIWGSIIDMVDDLAGEVELIIMRMKMGDPLQGTCELCLQTSQNANIILKKKICEEFSKLVDEKFKYPVRREDATLWLEEAMEKVLSKNLGIDI